MKTGDGATHRGFKSHPFRHKFHTKGSVSVSGICTNYLTVIGNHTDVLRFVSMNTGVPAEYGLHKNRTHKEEVFCFNAMVPIPEDIEVFDYGFGKDRDMSIKDWCYENWGTGVDILNGAEIQWNNDESLTIVFTTVWSPPRDWFWRVSMAFKNLVLSLHYEIPALNYGGDFSCEGGVAAMNEYFIN